MNGGFFVVINNYIGGISMRGIRIVPVIDIPVIPEPQIYGQEIFRACDACSIGVYGNDRAIALLTSENNIALGDALANRLSEACNGCFANGKDGRVINNSPEINALRLGIER
jgi:hypothetical protein